MGEPIQEPVIQGLAKGRPDVYYAGILSGAPIAGDQKASG